MAAPDRRLRFALPEPRREQLLDAGRAARSDIPREAHADFIPASDRDPVGILRRQNEARLPHLLGLRAERMTASPFTFYRGAAAVQAADLADGIHTNTPVTICGDSHISNFGIFASPERSIVFDLNDFDEAAYGPWEWDVKRMVTSVILAGRDNGFSDAATRAAAQHAARAYREALRNHVELGQIDRYFLRADPTKGTRTTSAQKILDKTIKQAGRRTAARVMSKITAPGPDGTLQLVESPPVLTHMSAATEDEVAELLGTYLTTVSPDIAVLVSQFAPRDVALRVVGVGSVGTRCYIALFSGPAGEPLILQVKQATESTAVQFGRLAEPCDPVVTLVEDDRRHGQRVVANQRILQSVSDPFLGFLAYQGRSFYVRQFRDQNTGFDIGALDVPAFRDYVYACGTVLARAHGQSDNAAFIAGYLGRKSVFDKAVVAWSYAYADQNDLDLDAARQAVADGTW